ncbi:hypothetical protein ACWGNR_07710 [Streptomyces althioticus]
MRGKLSVENMSLPFAEVSGPFWLTSQCSAIFPSWKRKMSNTASPRVPGVVTTPA